LVTVDQIIDELSRSRRPLDRARVDLPSVPGLYALFLSNSGSLPPFGGPTDLIYIGKSESSLQVRDFRQHFETGKTGHSTVRRSIGAILRRDLGLQAVPRKPDATKRELTHYKFRLEDEGRLSAWMRQNLDIGFVALRLSKKEEIRELERLALRAMMPPLNIDGTSARRNPCAKLLKALRAECMEEAALVVNRAQVVSSGVVPYQESEGPN